MLTFNSKAEAKSYANRLNEEHGREIAHVRMIEGSWTIMFFEPGIFKKKSGWPKL